MGSGAFNAGQAVAKAARGPQLPAEAHIAGNAAASALATMAQFMQGAGVRPDPAAAAAVAAQAHPAVAAAVAPAVTREMRDAALQAQPSAAAADASANSYDKSVANYAAGNGGQVSLRAMGALAHIANETSAYHMQVRNQASNDAIAQAVQHTNEIYDQKTEGLDASKKEDAALIDKANDERLTRLMAAGAKINPLSNTVADQVAQATAQ